VQESQRHYIQQIRKRKTKNKYYTLSTEKLHIYFKRLDATVFHSDAAISVSTNIISRIPIETVKNKDVTTFQFIVKFIRVDVNFAFQRS